MRTIQCFGFAVFLIVILNIVLFKGRLIKKVRHELKADIKALRAMSSEIKSADDNMEKHPKNIEQAVGQMKEQALTTENEEQQPEVKNELKHPRGTVKPFHYHYKRPLTKDLWDELYMEEQLIKAGLAPQDEFHEINHEYLVKIPHHADKGH